ncbi:response regulator transcription factor [Chroococcidiopsis sp.]|uniref:response regulator transcription factor n=1 Tax=Chroococcidiopsis sp. TaxID=3088168 RepID=UPI003F39FA46
MSQILIVEDEARLAAFVEKGLGKSGFNTLVATDGEQAIELARTSQPDLLLLDLGLPIKDGWQVMQELRSKGEVLPIVIMTARDDNQCKAAALQAGANDYITKPFLFKDLLGCIQAQLEIACKPTMLK